MLEYAVRKGHVACRFSIQSDADVDAGEDPQLGNDGGVLGGYAVDLPFTNRRGVAVLVGVGVLAGVGVEVLVDVDVGVLGGVGVGVLDGIGVGVRVGVGLGVGVLVGVEV